MLTLVTSSNYAEPGPRADFDAPLPNKPQGDPGVSKTERRYGSVPPSRHRLFAVLSMTLGAIVVVARLVINWVTSTSVRWGRLSPELVRLMAGLGSAIVTATPLLWCRTAKICIGDKLSTVIVKS